MGAIASEREKGIAEDKRWPFRWTRILFSLACVSNHNDFEWNYEISLRHSSPYKWAGAFLELSRSFQASAAQLNYNEMVTLCVTRFSYSIVIRMMIIIYFIIGNRFNVFVFLSARVSLCTFCTRQQYADTKKGENVHIRFRQSSFSPSLPLSHSLRRDRLFARPRAHNRTWIAPLCVQSACGLVCGNAVCYGKNSKIAENSATSRWMVAVVVCVAVADSYFTKLNSSLIIALSRNCLLLLLLLRACVTQRGREESSYSA